MKFSKIKSDNMRLGDDAKVSSTVIRQVASDEFSGGVLKNSRLAPFVGNYPERPTINNVDYLVPVEEHSRQLSEYAQKVQEAVNPKKDKRG